MAPSTPLILSAGRTPSLATMFVNYKRAAGGVRTPSVAAGGV